MIQVRGFHREDSDDDFSDDEELQTPIDEVDPFIFFVETIQGKGFFNVWVHSLSKCSCAQSYLTIL